MTRRRVASDARGDEAVGFGAFPEMPTPATMAGEKPIPAPSAFPGYVAPPSANKVVGYRAWFGAILLLEYALVLKAMASFKAYETRSVEEVNLLTHRWVYIVVCVVIDAVVLWFVNAFPGVPNTGLARLSEKDAAAARGERRSFRVGAASSAARLPGLLRVPQHVPLLARHAVKLFNRVPTISSVLMGSNWRLYHGYTQTQTLLMVLNPTFLNVAFGGGNLFFLTAQSVINVLFVLMLTYLNPDAYALYPDTMRPDFQRNCGDTSTFYTVVSPIVVVAPFAFAYLLRRNVSGLEFLWRVYFGEQAQLGKEAKLESTPWMILRNTAKRVIPLALSLIVGAVAHACVTGFDDAFDAYAAPSTSVTALSVVCLVASVTVPGKLADAFSASPQGLRAFNENVRNGAEKAAFQVAAAYAAASASACALVTRGNILGIPTHAVTSIAVHAWLPAWGIVAACACAVTPSPGVPRAARAAAAAAAVAAAGLVVIDPRAVEYVAAFANDQTTNCAIATLLAYLCALHAPSAWSIHARLFSEYTPGGTDDEMQEMLWVEATKSGLPRARKGHWQPEDFELDPSRFEMRPRNRHRSLDDPRYAFVPLSRDGRGGTGGENAFEGFGEPFASARGVSMCRAKGCGEPVKSSDVLAEGLNLCAEHMVAEEQFQCELRGGAAHFCVQCLRVHSPPRCFDTVGDGARFPRSLRVSVETNVLSSDATSVLKTRSSALHEKNISMRVWYKTEEGPVEATARMRDVVGDFASLRPGNVRVLHAEVTARTGCTLLTVDIAALLDDDDAASQCDARNDVVDGDAGSDDARDEDIARAFVDAGVRNRLDGVLDFEITGGVSSEARQRTLRRLAFDGRKRTSTTMELEIAPHFAHFARFQRFGPFGAESAARGDDGELNGGANDPRLDDQLPVLRSDRYDVLALPTAPEGFVYVLRCGGTYLPLLAPLNADRAATRVLHAPPSDAEGLGFIELIASRDLEEHEIDLEDGPVDFSGPVDISPLLSTAVFITPDDKLATELGDPVTGARAEHAPMLFNIGAALTGRASGAVVGASGPNGNARSPGDLDDSERVREEAVFHAACGAASMGWSFTMARVIANLDRSDINDNAAWMSESPDTATDEYDNSSAYSSDGSCRRVSREAAKARRPQTLGTLAGAATLMRAACSSGDALTSRVAIAWVIRNFGAVVASDLLSVGDGGGVGKDWTPLHAAAFAVARRVQESAALESRLARALAMVEMVTRGASRSVSADVIAAADEVTGILTLSRDPLSWVRNSASSAAAPSAVLRGAGDTGSSTFSRIAAWRTGRERVALDERILQTLSVATRNAVDFLRSVTPFENPMPVHEHFAAAASLATFAYDGSKASTMAVAILFSASSKSWDALRARALDDTRGDVSEEEAMDWLRMGAPSDGFPVPSAEEIMARDVGVEASVLCTAIDAAMMSSVTVPATRSLGYGALGPLRAGAVLSQWLAPAACFFARAAVRPSKRLGSERRFTNERVRLVGAVAQTLVTYFTKRLLIGRDDRLSALPLVVPCAVRCALVFAQAVAVPCGSLAKETTCVFVGALACFSLVADSGDFLLSSSIPGVSFLFRVALIATLVARCARWCVPRVARTRVDKLASERMAAFDGEAKKTA